MKRWSSSKFKGRFKLLKELKNQIAHLNTLSPFESLASQIWQKEKEDECFLQDEEIYWAQRAKAMGLSKVT